jgi:hypothetical protein
MTFQQCWVDWPTAYSSWPLHHRGAFGDGKNSSANPIQYIVGCGRVDLSGLRLCALNPRTHRHDAQELNMRYANRGSWMEGGPHSQLIASRAYRGSLITHHVSRFTPQMAPSPASPSTTVTLDVLTTVLSKLHLSDAISAPKFFDAILEENAEPSKKGLPTSSAHRQAILQRALRSFFVILQYIPLISEPIQW